MRDSTTYRSARRNEARATGQIRYWTRANHTRWRPAQANQPRGKNFQAVAGLSNFFFPSRMRRV